MLAFASMKTADSQNNIVKFFFCLILHLNRKYVLTILYSDKPRPVFLDIIFISLSYQFPLLFCMYETFCLKAINVEDYIKSLKKHCVFAV